MKSKKDVVRDSPTNGSTDKNAAIPRQSLPGSDTPENATNPLSAYKSVFAEIFSKLMAFTLEDEFDERLGGSIEFFYNLKEGDSYEFDPGNEFLFLSWFLLDDVDADECSLMDTYLQRFADTTSIQETQVCHALQETHLTLLEVIEVIPHKSMRLRDVFLGEEFDVVENAGAEQGFKGKLLFTRVLNLGDTRFLVGAGMFLDRSLLEGIAHFMTEQFQRECETHERKTFREFLKENGELINWWIRAWEKGELLELDEE
ncbi:MAG: hypothetical protein HQM09_13335 [Candidatus Riflebacteria bacterium]|nr:hypothetical protein [Candidatus Riflebacteria bacterium]